MTKWKCAVLLLLNHLKLLHQAEGFFFFLDCHFCMAGNIMPSCTICTTRMVEMAIIFLSFFFKGHLFWKSKSCILIFYNRKSQKGKNKYCASLVCTIGFMVWWSVVRCTLLCSYWICLNLNMGVNLRICASL